MHLIQKVVLSAVLFGMAAPGLAQAAHYDTNNSSTTRLPGQIHLVDGAIETLDAYSLSYPNQTELANANFSSIHAQAANITAELAKWNASGVDYDDLVTMTPPKNISKTTKEDCDCTQCNLCLKACFSLVWCLPCWGICEGACFAQDYCACCRF